MSHTTRILMPRRPAPLSAGLLLGLTVLLALPFCDRLVGSAGAHPGDLDEYGGHIDDRTGSYHYHRPKADMSRRKEEYLTWNPGQDSGELRGAVVQVDRPDAVWMHIPYRPAYQDLARILSPSNRDDERQRVLFWLAHVSPEGSAAFGKEYNDWFYKKVIYELDNKLRGQPATAQFRVLSAAGRLHGMLLREDENINLWMVLNGWSYYVLTGAPNPYADQFIQAEAKARRDKAGLWERAQ